MKKNKILIVFTLFLMLFPSITYAMECTLKENGEVKNRVMETLTCSYQCSSREIYLKYEFMDKTGMVSPTVNGQTTYNVDDFKLNAGDPNQWGCKKTITVDGVNVSDPNKPEGQPLTPPTTSYKKIQCGEDLVVPYLLPKIISTVILILQIATPIIIIIFGSIDLIKAVMAQKEDEIKKGQQTFVRRLIVGSAVFLVFAVVKMGIGIVAPHNSEEKEVESMWNCIDCFVRGDCDDLEVNN